MKKYILLLIAIIIAHIMVVSTAPAIDSAIGSQLAVDTVNGGTEQFAKYTAYYNTKQQRGMIFTVGELLLSGIIVTKMYNKFNQNENEKSN